MYLVSKQELIKFQLKKTKWIKAENTCMLKVQNAKIKVPPKARLEGT